MYKNYLPLMQMNHYIVEVFTIGVVFIRNQKVLTNIVANMSLVEMIKEVITDRHGAKAKHFVGLLTSRFTIVIMSVIWLATGLRLTLRLAMFIMSVT
jgi:hypothetical protein